MVLYIVAVDRVLLSTYQLIESALFSDIGEENEGQDVNEWVLYREEARPHQR